MNNSLKYQFLEFVREHELIAAGQRIIVAGSGGVDSMVLLNLLLEWQSHLDIELAVAHFNHQLRGEDADLDEALVREVAEVNNLQFWSDRDNVAATAAQNKWSIEEAGRYLRDAFFRDCLQTHNFDLIATAHHLDDQAETILMRIIAGTGIEGLSGIRLRRDAYIRPLLFAEKRRLLEWAEQQQIQFRHDASNEDERFTRNRVRQHLLPLLRNQFGMQELKPFLRLGLTAADWEAYVKAQVSEVLENADFIGDQNKIRLVLTVWNQYFSGIQIRVLESIFERQTGLSKKLVFEQFRSFEKWLKGAAPGKRYRLLDAIEVTMQDDHLTFSPHRTPVPVDQTAPLDGIIQLAELGLSISFDRLLRSEVTRLDTPGVEFLDADKLTLPLRIRTWVAGDKFRPLGMSNRKKVSDFLTDAPALLLAKKEMLVLEHQTGIVAVVGARIDDNYKITDQTRNVLKIEARKI